MEVEIVLEMKIGMLSQLPFPLFSELISRSIKLWIQSDGKWWKSVLYFPLGEKGDLIVGILFTYYLECLAFLTHRELNQKGLNTCTYMRSCTKSWIIPPKPQFGLIFPLLVFSLFEPWFSFKKKMSTLYSSSYEVCTFKWRRKLGWIEWIVACFDFSSLTE